MAERPIFVPIFDGQELVREIFLLSNGVPALRQSRNKKISGLYIKQRPTLAFRRF